MRKNKVSIGFISKQKFKALVLDKEKFPKTKAEPENLIIFDDYASLMKINKEKKSNESPVVTCKCGAIIDHDLIDRWNGCNEEGEDYGKVSANCKCGRYYETYQWGEWDSKLEAIECLRDFINENNT